MAKKSAKKTKSKKTTSKKTKTHKKSKETSAKLEEKVLQNLVSLQKVHVDLAHKFESLSEQISNLLALFEMSARTFASQPHTQKTENDKEFLEKIDKLLEQNKVLAKGLTLMESKMRERLYGPGSRVPPNRPMQKPGFKNPNEI